MTKPLDLTNKKFNRLTALKRVENDKYGSARWLCVCVCGNETIVTTNSLRRGHTKSCGCYQSEQSIKNLPDTTTHKLSRTRIYRIWHLMVQRCNNPSHKSYSYYGGRGIKVCDEWLHSSTFFDWAFKNGYTNKLTLERINVNQGYEPTNCCWIPPEKQASNKRNTIKVNYCGEEITLKELSKKTKIPYPTLFQRMKAGYTEAELTLPLNTIRKQV